MKRSSKLIILSVSIIAVLLLVAVIGGRRSQLPIVETEAVSRQTINETVTASGKIQPEVEVKISAEVSGLLFELPVKEGDIVEAGQLLVGINPDIYESAINRADAAVNTARSTLASARARKL
jgi:HlyD family secretion protein